MDEQTLKAHAKLIDTLGARALVLSDIDFLRTEPIQLDKLLRER